MSDRDKNSDIDKAIFKTSQPRTETNKSRKQAKLSLAKIKACVDVPIDDWNNNGHADSDESSNSNSND